MKTRRVGAITRKEFIHIIRDPRSLGMAIAIPMLLLLLFGYALTLDVDNVPLVVWDQSRSPASRELISRFSGSRYFAVSGQASNYLELEKAIDSGQALMGLVIPTDFAGGIAAGRATSVQLIVDGSDSNTATIAMGYADAIMLTYSQQLVLSRLQRAGGRQLELPVNVEPRVWFNAELESKNYIIPGLIAVIMMVIAALLTSLTIAREWERGTMEQLISTPIKGYELILGKLLPYFAIGILDVLLALLMGEFLFQVPLRGNVALLFVLASIFLIGALSLGMVISIVTKSQLLASQLATITTFMPSFLLSGFMYAISNLPKPIQIVSNVVLAKHFVPVLKGIYLKGVGLEVLAFEAVFLIIFGLIVLAVCNLKFRKKLE